MYEMAQDTYRIYKARKRISEIINGYSIPEDDDLLSSEMIALQDLGKNTLDLIYFAYIYGYARGRNAQ